MRPRLGGAPAAEHHVRVARDLDASGTFEAGEQFYYQADLPARSRRFASAKAGHLGSPRAITDAAGFVANSYDYDSYGRIESSSETVANPFTFTGRELDAESGLTFYRARYYDPATGRFLSEDPIGFAAGDTNLFRYVFNNPVNLRDPDGQVFFNFLACGVGAVVGGVQGGVGGALRSAGEVFDERFDDPLDPIEDEINRAKDRAGKTVRDALRRLRDEIRGPDGNETCENAESEGSTSRGDGNGPLNARQRNLLRNVGFGVLRGMGFGCLIGGTFGVGGVGAALAPMAGFGSAFFF